MSFVNRPKHEAERLADNLESDRREVATFCDVDRSDAGMSALPTHCNIGDRKTVAGVGEVDSEKSQSAITSQHGSSSTFNSHIPSSFEMTSTGSTSVCLTIKVEPSVEEQSNSSSPQENNKRYDTVSDDVTASGGVRCDGGCLNSEPCVHLTTSSPSVNFSHRLDCPCKLLPSVASSSAGTGVAEGHLSRRRRQPGLSRLRRTELRRRSRIVTDITEDLADGVGGTTSMTVKDRLGVDCPAPSDVISAEPRPLLDGGNAVAVSDAFSKFHDARMKPGYRGTIVQSTKDVQPNTCVTSSVVDTSTTIKAIHQSAETLGPSENKSNEKATADDASDRQVTNRFTMAKKKCPSIFTEHVEDRISVNAAGTRPAVSKRSVDISKMSASSSKAAPVNVWRTLNGDTAPLSSVVNAPVGVPLTPLFRRTVTQSALADAGAGSAGRSPIVDGPRCHVGSAVKWRCRYGDSAKKQRDVIVWMQTGRVALAAPVLRCGITTLKYNAVALVNSPAYYFPRHVPIIYPRYRLLCYRPSSCV